MIARRALVAHAAVACALAVSACSSCRHGGEAGEGESAATAKSAPPPAMLGLRDGGVPPRDEAMWAHARDGGEEDLATLAVHEGAAGLVEAAADPAWRPTAVRAMAFARGWAQLPYLAGVARTAGDPALADAAIDSVLRLAARPRRAEDPEDAEELREGCAKLVTLARDADAPRPRRARAVSALRMMPCPKAELPSDLDAR